MEEEEAEQKEMDRFDGCVVSYAALIKRLMKLGWCHFSEEDGYYIYYKENEEQ